MKTTNKTNNTEIMNNANDEIININGVDMKKCKVCGELRPLDEFKIDKRLPDGHVYTCNKCARKHRRENARIKAAADMAKETVDKCSDSKVTKTVREIKPLTKSRPAQYTSQPGNKATLCLADFTEENLFAELRRRGWSGELTYTKTVSV